MKRPFGLKVIMMIQILLALLFLFLPKTKPATVLWTFAATNLIISGIAVTGSFKRTLWGWRVNIFYFGFISLLLIGSYFFVPEIHFVEIITNFFLLVIGALAGMLYFYRQNVLEYYGIQKEYKLTPKNHEYLVILLMLFYFFTTLTRVFELGKTIPSFFTILFFQGRRNAFFLYASFFYPLLSGFISAGAGAGLLFREKWGLGLGIVYSSSLVVRLLMAFIIPGYQVFVVLERIVKLIFYSATICFFTSSGVRCLFQIQEQFKTKILIIYLGLGVLLGLAYLPALFPSI